MVAHARDCLPKECCGLLLGANGAIVEARAARNVHPDAARRFEIDPVALIAAHRASRSGGLQLVGYYHSHPAGAPAPSRTDREMAAGDGMVWAILAPDGEAWQVGFWLDGKRGFGRADVSLLPAASLP